MTIPLPDTSEIVRISFRHANPEAGNESFLLRFETGEDRAPCILVDAGHGVDLDPLLKPGDRLAAIALTHAHLDHYSSLAAVHREDVPVFTSPSTAAILEDVFDVAATEYDVPTSKAVDDAITPVDGWTTVTPSIEIHPIPAGHVPGAVGFLVRATEDKQSHHLLATGDFTTRRAAGFPGFDPDGFVDIDTLFLTAATSDGFEASLTDALGTALEHAHGGSPTLVTTSGIVGPQVAYLLSLLADEHDLQVPIRVVGQVAKLYDALHYDCSGVESVPYFGDTAACLGPGTIAIAGPEIPRDRSSGRLYGVLRENPNACVVQLIGSGEAPVSGGQCTVHSYELTNHPTRETLVDVHDALDPTQTVLTHSHGGAEGDFNDLSSAVWGSGDTEEYTLFDHGQWRLPPWMAGGVIADSGGRSVKQFASADLLASFRVPSLGRRAEPDLEAEGVDTEQIERRLHRGPDSTGNADIPSDLADRADADSATDTTTTSMTANGDETTSRDDVPSVTAEPTGLTRTTGPKLDHELDPASRAALDEQSLTPEDIIATVAARERLVEQDVGDVDGEDENRPDSAEDTAEDETETATSETASVGSPPDIEEQDDAVRDDDTGEGAIDATTRAASGAVDSEPDPSTETSADDEAGAEDDQRANHAIDRASSSGSESQQSASSGSESQSSEPSDGVCLDLNPLAVALAERAASRERGENRRDEPVDAVIVEAVEQYVVALLAGEASGTEAERFVVAFEGSRTVEQALNRLVGEDERFESSSALVAEGIASALDYGGSGTREIIGLGGYRRHLDAIRDNDAYVFEDVTEIVETAIARYAISASSSESPAT